MTYRGFCPCFLVESFHKKFFFDPQGGTVEFDVFFFPENIDGSCRRIGSFRTRKKTRTVFGKAERSEIVCLAEEIIRTRETVSMERPMLVNCSENLEESPLDPASEVFSWKGRRI